MSHGMSLFIMKCTVHTLHQMYDAINDIKTKGHFAIWFKWKTQIDLNFQWNPLNCILHAWNWSFLLKFQKKIEFLAKYILHLTINIDCVTVNKHTSIANEIQISFSNYVFICVNQNVKKDQQKNFLTEFETYFTGS